MQIRKHYFERASLRAGQKVHSRKICTWWGLWHQNFLNSRNKFVSKILNSSSFKSIGASFTLFGAWDGWEEGGGGACLTGVNAKFFPNQRKNTFLLVHSWGCSWVSLTKRIKASSNSEFTFTFFPLRFNNNQNWRDQYPWDICGTKVEVSLLSSSSHLLLFWWWIKSKKLIWVKLMSILKPLQWQKLANSGNQTNAANVSTYPLIQAI